MNSSPVLPKDDCNHLSDYMYFSTLRSIYTPEWPIPHQHMVAAIKDVVFTVFFSSFPASLLGSDSFQQRILVRN